MAACRYLGDRLVEAWTFEQHPLVAQLRGDTAAEGETDDLTIEARRRVAERCLFGVDRDPMAVEMAKLSLWLTTMAHDRPFTGHISVAATPCCKSSGGSCGRRRSSSPVTAFTTSTTGEIEFELKLNHFCEHRFQGFAPESVW